MPVPASINDLSTTAASNSPAGTESPTDGDNYIRAYGSFLAQLRDQLNGTTPTTALTVASLTFTTANGTTLNLSGNAAITGTLGVTGLATFTDITTSGNTVLGNAATDTLNVGASNFLTDASGNAGFGAIASQGKVSVRGVNRSITSGQGQLFAYSSDSMAIDLGGQVVLGGSYTGTTQTSFACVSGRKENGTGSDISGYLSLSTGRDGVGMAERVRISSLGVVDILAGSGSLRTNGHITRFETTAACPTSAGVGSLTTVAHGGTRRPDAFSVRLRCVTTEHGYAVGDEVDLVSIGGSVIYSCSANATNISFRMPSATGGVPQVFIASGGNSQPAVTAANWLLVFKAIWL